MSLGRGAAGASALAGPLSKQEGWTPRRLLHLRELLPPGDFDIDALTLEWESVLEINYWPIFATASEIVRKLPEETAAAVLTPLRKGALRLVQRGVTKSHDLTGVIFQRLIADRKFLATFYTRPAAAALLAGLAIPADRAPGGAVWGDEETIAVLQIGDFACGTGTLLSAAYQRISLLHELNGGDPRALHAPMMKNGLVGLDVLNIAVHLTATMLAGAHPDVPFEGECLLTMPYGWESASIGSLELLTEHVQAQMISQAAAVTAGGRQPEDLKDLMTRVGHGKFDLVIMNPPFTTNTNEGKTEGVGNPAFAAFDTTPGTQKAMRSSLRQKSGKDAISTTNAGLAASFVDLALRKLRPGGVLAFVLPVTAMSGDAWTEVRHALEVSCDNVVLVSISAGGSFERSFSNDTGIAECLLIGRKRQASSSALSRPTFVSLNGCPSGAAEGYLIADAIERRRAPTPNIRIEEQGISRTIRLGGSNVGWLATCPVTAGESWKVTGIRDDELASTAFAMFEVEKDRPEVDDWLQSIPIARIGSIGTRGPHARDINSAGPPKQPRGPFEIHRPPLHAVPERPVLWARDTKSQRGLVVPTDSEASKRVVDGYQDSIDTKAVRVWQTASTTHYSREVQFNANSLIVATTNREAIGGRAWPSVKVTDPFHQYAFALWCNSSLGLLAHWWCSNKSQSGRGMTSVTALPNIPTLDTRALTDAQHAEAKRQFDLLSSERFLPFDQIDEDPARAKSDRAILVDVLGLPESLVADDGPIDLIRRKLAREPQIHGGKRSRVVFTENGEDSQPRTDRR